MQNAAEYLRADAAARKRARGIERARREDERNARAATSQRRADSSSEAMQRRSWINPVLAGDMALKASGDDEGTPRMEERAYERAYKKARVEISRPATDTAAVPSASTGGDKALMSFAVSAARKKGIAGHGQPSTAAPTESMPWRGLSGSRQASPQELKSGISEASTRMDSSTAGGGGLPIRPEDAAFTPGGRSFDHRGFRSRFRRRGATGEQGRGSEPSVGSFRDRFRRRNVEGVSVDKASGRQASAPGLPAAPPTLAGPADGGKARRVSEAEEAMKRHGVALPAAPATLATGEAGRVGAGAQDARAARRAQVMRELMRERQGRSEPPRQERRQSSSRSAPSTQPAHPPAAAPPAAISRQAKDPLRQAATAPTRPPAAHPPYPTPTARGHPEGEQRPPSTARPQGIRPPSAPPAGTPARPGPAQGMAVGTAGKHSGSAPGNRSSAAALRAMLGGGRRKSTGKRQIAPAAARLPTSSGPSSSTSGPHITLGRVTGHSERATSAGPDVLPLVDEHGRLADGALLRRGAGRDATGVAPLEAGDLRSRPGRRTGQAAGPQRAGTSGDLSRRFASDGLLGPDSSSSASAAFQASDAEAWREQAARDLRAERAAGRAVAAGGAASGRAALQSLGVGDAALGAAQDLDAVMARNLLRKGRGAAEAAQFLSGAGASRAGRGEEDTERDEAVAVALASGAADRMTGRAQEEAARRRTAQAWRQEQRRRSEDPYLVGGPAFEAPRLLYAGKHWLVMAPREQQPPTGTLQRGVAAHDGPRLGPWHVLLVARGGEDDGSGGGGGPAASSTRSAEEEAYAEGNQLRARFDRMVAARGSSWTEVDQAECGASRDLGTSPGGWEAKGYYDERATGGTGPVGAALGIEEDEDVLAVPEGALGRMQDYTSGPSKKPAGAAAQPDPTGRPRLQAVFVEHAHRIGKAGVRAVVHCLGLPVQGGPSRVSQTIRQALSQWVASERRATSAAAEPRLIDATGKGLRGCVPEGFNYLHVGWRGGGIVCPLDDSVDGLPPGFALDALCGAAGWAPARIVAAERSAARGKSSKGQEATKQAFEWLQSRVTALAYAWKAAEHQIQ